MSIKTANLTGMGFPSKSAPFKKKEEKKKDKKKGFAKHFGKN
jgi:hypothetical protein